jgi:hypothetical protein
MYCIQSEVMLSGTYPFVSPETLVAFTPAAVLDLCNKHSFSYVISCVKISHFIYTSEHQMFMFSNFVKSGSARKVRRRFWHRFQNVAAPHRDT